MMHRAAVIAVATFLGMPAQAFEAGLVAGLDVTTERVPESVVVDGVLFTIERATGSDVPELARRIESQWRSQGSEIHPLQQGGWTLRTRRRGAFSEVLQWRSSDRMHELLWSSINSESAPLTSPRAGLMLPSQCNWGRAIHGRSAGHEYLQRSARCTVSADSLQSTMQASLPAQGWRSRSGRGSGMLLDRPGAAGFLSITPLNDGGAWLVWLRVEQSDHRP